VIGQSQRPLSDNTSLSHSDTPHSVGLLWTSDRPVTETSTWQYVTITFRHTTLGRTPLDKWSASHRDLYLTTHNTHNRQTSIPQAEFEPATPSKRAPADPDGGKIRHCRNGFLKWIDWGNKFDFLDIQSHSVGLLSFLSPNSRHVSEERLSGSRHPSRHRFLKNHAHLFDAQTFRSSPQRNSKFKTVLRHPQTARRLQTDHQIPRDKSVDVTMEICDPHVEWKGKW